MQAKTVNHWGKWVSSDTPVTGVISSNNINWEFVNNDEICLTCEEIYKEIEETDICPECGGDLITKGWVENDGEYIECQECGQEWDKDEALEFVECDSSHTKIIGDWILDTKTGQYEPDKNGEFSAIVRESVIQVVWSKFLATNKMLCSPCYPGQVDLDSENGDFTGYTLPDYLIYQDDDYGYAEQKNFD